MPIRDTWHRTLVYFGLAEDEGYEDDEYDAPVDGRTGRRGQLPRAPERSPAEPHHAAGETTSTTSSPTTPPPSGVRRPRCVRSAAAPSRNGGDVRVHFVAPRSFNDVQDVADKFKQSIPVIINLQGTDADLSKRLIDFASGLTYALDGGMDRIADKVFLLTPRNVEVSSEERARLVEKGFFNQS